LQTAGVVTIVGCYTRSLLYTSIAYSGYKNAAGVATAGLNLYSARKLKNQIALNEAIAQCRIFPVQ